MNDDGGMVVMMMVGIVVRIIVGMHKDSNDGRCLKDGRRIMEKWW